MIFNWILSNKFAIGTPLTTQKDQLLLKEKKITSILDLRNKFDLNQINYQEQGSTLESDDLAPVFKTFPRVFS